MKPETAPPFSFPVSAAISAKLAKLGIHSEADLLLHLPLRWEDETHITPIRDLLPGQTAQIQATITQNAVLYRPRRTLSLSVEDGSGTLGIRFLHFYPSHIKAFATGACFRFIGEVRGGFFGLEMVHPRFVRVEVDTPLPEGLTPVYPTTAGLGQASLRKLISRALEKPISDTLPDDWLAELDLQSIDETLRLLHRPPPSATTAALEAKQHRAWRRLAFDELLAQQLSLASARRLRRARAATPLLKRGTHSAAFLGALPFRLTAAQQRSWNEISADLAQPHPMRRLLQGDVGSGKTVVAALACLQAIENQQQVAFMAPTEILAEQHYLKLAPLMSALGIRIGWLSGSQRQADKRAAIESISCGTTDLAFGTHALFQEGVRFARLGFAIIDEQHRFGVGQRLALAQKGVEPHQLMMSATPIPRTLAMSYYADLDVSIIDTLPPGRLPIKTRLVADTRRDEVLARVRAACQTGGQAYWVCPLIEESENEVSAKANVSETNVKRSGRSQKLQLITAQDTYATLVGQLPELTIGLIHGRMKTAEKNAVMTAFQTGAIQLLVATTVIEVGVDVANASLMVIEHAERMGLAQLHQLRGRVGRGSRESVCVLLYQTPLSDLARARLKVIYEHTDGFEIARQDLLLRGPGELIGSRQSGLPLLRFADLERDTALLDQARAYAQRALDERPELIPAHLARWLGRRQHFSET